MKSTREGGEKRGRKGADAIRGRFLRGRGENGPDAYPRVQGVRIQVKSVKKRVKRGGRKGHWPGVWREQVFFCTRRRRNIGGRLTGGGRCGPCWQKGKESGVRGRTEKKKGPVISPNFSQSLKNLARDVKNLIHMTIKVPKNPGVGVGGKPVAKGKWDKLSDSLWG